jgi:NAD(P)-dependent dehydrogenase (short-subunit alcohol dehydrogenase family)
MKPILVTGATGTVGRQVVSQLLATDVRVRALTRDPALAKLPAAVDVRIGSSIMLMRSGVDFSSTFAGKPCELMMNFCITSFGVTASPLLQKHFIVEFTASAAL